MQQLLESINMANQRHTSFNMTMILNLNPNPKPFLSLNPTF